MPILRPRCNHVSVSPIQRFVHLFRFKRLALCWAHGLMSPSSLCFLQLPWKEALRWPWRACSDTSLGPRGPWDSTEAWHPTSWKSFHLSASATLFTRTWSSRWGSSQSEEGGQRLFCFLFFWAEDWLCWALRNKQLPFRIFQSNNQIPVFKG